MPSSWRFPRRQLRASSPSLTRSAASSPAKSPAIHQASSALSSSPMRGPAGTPSAMTSAPPRGNRGGCQRSGRVKRSRQSGSSGASPDRAQAISTSCRYAVVALSVKAGPGDGFRRAWANGWGTHGRQHQFGMFLVGEPQTVAQAIGVLRDLDRQRAEPQHRIRCQRERPFDVCQSAEQMGPRRNRKHIGGKPVALHGGDELGPTSRRQQAQQLLANALSRQDRQTLALGHAGAEAVRVGRALPVLGREPEEAQDAQVVLADALPGIADEAHAALGEIGIAFERVEHLTVGRAVESVDREIAAARVGRPVGGEGHGGVAAVRLHVLAQRGDLVGHVLGDHGDGAMGDAGGHCSEPGGFGGGDHLLGRGRRWRGRCRPPAGRAARCARHRRRRGPQTLGSPGR